MTNWCTTTQLLLCQHGDLRLTRLQLFQDASRELTLGRHWLGRHWLRWHSGRGCSSWLGLRKRGGCSLLLRRYNGSASLLQCWLLEGHRSRASSSPAHYRLRYWYAERFCFRVHVCRLLETGNTGDSRNTGFLLSWRLRLLCWCSRLTLTSLCLLGFHRSNVRAKILNVSRSSRALFSHLSGTLLIVETQSSDELLVVPCKRRSLPLTLAHDVVSRLVGHGHLRHALRPVSVRVLSVRGMQVASQFVDHVISSRLDSGLAAMPPSRSRLQCWVHIRRGRCRHTRADVERRVHGEVNRLGRCRLLWFLWLRNRLRWQTSRWWWSTAAPTAAATGIVVIARSRWWWVDP